MPCKPYGALAFLFGLTTVLTGQEPWRPPAPGVVAFVDITVIPMDRERVVPHQTVVVRGDRIVALGPVAEVAVPADAQRVAGEGKFLVPGLGDMHFHTALLDTVMARKGALIALALGITTARSMAGSPLHLALREWAARGEVAGPQLYTAGPALGLNIAAPRTVAEAAQLVTAQKATGYDFLKLYRSDLDRDVLDSLSAAATRVGLPLAGQVAMLDSARLAWALAVPFRSIEHLGESHFRSLEPLQLSYVPGRPDAWPDDARLRRMAAQMQAHGVWHTPTLSVTARSAGGFLGGARRVSRPVGDYHKFIMALHAAGAGMLLGTDRWWGMRCYTSQDVSPIRLELQALVAAGLTPYQALETGTRNVAAFFGTTDSVGTVAVGKRADLVLLDGNPLERANDFTSLNRPAGVMAGGRWLPRAVLDEGLAAFGCPTPPRP